VRSSSLAISFMFGIHSAEPKDPTYNAFAAALKTIGGDNAFFLLVPVLAGFIAMSIADRSKRDCLIKSIYQTVPFLKYDYWRRNLLISSGVRFMNSAIVWLSKPF
ncbi:hypothetical protein ABWL24_25250, partial [Priestia megaterium]